MERSHTVTYDCYTSIYWLPLLSNILCHCSRRQNFWSISSPDWKRSGLIKDKVRFMKTHCLDMWSQFNIDFDIWGLARARGEIRLRREFAIKLNLNLLNNIKCKPHVLPWTNSQKINCPRFYFIHWHICNKVVLVLVFLKSSLTDFFNRGTMKTVALLMVDCLKKVR